MGWYLRKSKKIGPFRINLPKSGIGMSVGMRGFRVGTGPKGQYVHAGLGGLYYRKHLSTGNPADLQQLERFCSSCGTLLSTEAAFCNQCGATVPMLPAAPARRSLGSLVGVLVVAFAILLVVGGLSGIFDSRTPGPVSSSSAVQTPQPPPLAFTVVGNRPSSPVIVTVADSASSADIAKLLGYMRARINNQQFSELGIKHPTAPAPIRDEAHAYSAGRIVVFRASEFSPSQKTTFGNARQSQYVGEYRWGIAKKGNEVARVKTATGWTAVP